MVRSRSCCVKKTRTLVTRSTESKSVASRLIPRRYRNARSLATFRRPRAKELRGAINDSPYPCYNFVSMNRTELESAIQQLEQHRGTLPEEVIDTSIRALRAQLDSLNRKQESNERLHATVLFIDLAGFTA